LQAQEWPAVDDQEELEMGGISMIRTICSSVYGALILVAAIIPPTLLIIEKALQ
jgi:hypothetical protein